MPSVKPPRKPFKSGSVADKPKEPPGIWHVGVQSQNLSKVPLGCSVKSHYFKPGTPFLEPTPAILGPKNLKISCYFFKKQIFIGAPRPEKLNFRMVLDSPG